MSDSGGLQEECCILKKQHITLRNNTERPETIKINSNIISNLSFNVINKRIKFLSKKQINWKHPYKNNVSEKILKIISK